LLPQVGQNCFDMSTVVLKRQREKINK